MTALEDFRRELIAQRPELVAWGSFVREQIRAELEHTAVSLQIVSSRAKEVDSAIGKIARKDYKDPLHQMTDLVGVRFVVLISPHIEPIAEIVEACKEWEARLDRDADQEIVAAPETFGYQSKHYVVRNSVKRGYEGVPIRVGLPCEIQIRTIMQHAYAEVTHDSIYKPSAGRVPPKAKRFVASSMALIETADHLFCETMRLLELENRPRNQLWKGLVDLYESLLGSDGLGYDEKLNLAVLDQLAAFQTDTALEETKFLFRNRATLVQKIKGRVPSDPFWSQPTALYAYWLVGRDGAAALDAWPFASAHDALGLVYSDLGQSQPR